MLLLLQWKSNKYYILWVCICSLRYPSCNAHAPYCHLWPVQLHRIFPHYILNGVIFERRKATNTIYVLWFSLQLLSEICIIVRRIQRDMVRNVYWSPCKALVILVEFNEIWIFWTVFFLEMYPNMKFHENPSSGSRVISWKPVKWEPSYFMKIRPVGAELFHENPSSGSRVISWKSVPWETSYFYENPSSGSRVISWKSFLWEPSYFMKILPVGTELFHEKTVQWEPSYFMKNPSSGSRVISCGRTDSQSWWS